MRTRPAQIEDYDRLREIHAESGVDFPMPEVAMIEAAEVVVDDEGNVLMGAAAKRVPEIYFFCPAGQLHPVVKMEGIRLLHGALRDSLAGKGYAEYFGFIPPKLARSFGRHLGKWFGWQKAWPAYRILDWKEEPECQKE